MFHALKAYRWPPACLKSTQMFTGSGLNHPFLNPMLLLSSYCDRSRRLSGLSGPSHSLLSESSPADIRSRCSDSEHGALVLRTGVSESVFVELALLPSGPWDFHPLCPCSPPQQLYLIRPGWTSSLALATSPLSIYTSRTHISSCSCSVMPLTILWVGCYPSRTPRNTPL